MFAFSLGFHVLGEILADLRVTKVSSAHLFVWSLLVWVLFFVLFLERAAATTPKPKS